MYTEKPPYLIVPPAGADFNQKALVEGLPDTDKIVVIYPKDMPQALGAPVGGGGVMPLIEATKWVLCLEPGRLIQLGATFVLTYGATEYVKGLASEAGKDTWKAIKVLLKRIFAYSDSQTKNPNSKALPLQIKGNYSTSDESRRVFSLILDPNWTKDEKDSHLLQLESAILPVIFSFFSQTEEAAKLVPIDTEGNNLMGWCLRHMTVSIGPNLNHPNEWWVNCDVHIGSTALLLVDPVTLTIRWDKHVWKTDDISDLFIKSFEEHGYKNCGESDLYYEWIKR